MAGNGPTSPSIIDGLPVIKTSIKQEPVISTVVEQEIYIGQCRRLLLKYGNNSGSERWGDSGSKS